MKCSKCKCVIPQTEDNKAYSGKGWLCPTCCIYKPFLKILKKKEK